MNTPANLVVTPGSLVRVLAGAARGQYDDTDCFQNVWVEGMAASVGAVMRVVWQSFSGVYLCQPGETEMAAELCYAYPPQILAPVGATT